MKHKSKLSYTIPCSSKFRRDVRALAETGETTIGAIARSVFFLFSPETIKMRQDPGGPQTQDRDLVQIKTGSNAGKTLQRKPRIQLRLAGGYSAADVRKALDIALDLKKRNAFKIKNIADGSSLPSAVETKSLKNELTALKESLSKLLFTPLEGGVKTKLDALYVFGFPSKLDPTKMTITARYKELASVYHPDTALGSHTHMTQINQAYQILKNNI